MRKSTLIVLLFCCGLVVTLFQNKPSTERQAPDNASFEEHRIRSVYSFSERANEMITLMFPQRVIWDDVHVTPDVSWAITEERAPKDFEEAYLRQLFQLPPTKTIIATDLMVVEEPSNSQYIGIHSTDEKRLAVLLSESVSGKLGRVLDQLAAEPLSFNGVLEKAVFQRDVRHIMEVYINALSISSDADALVANNLLSKLRNVFEQCYLSEEEFADLKLLYSLLLDRSIFHVHHEFRLDVNYIPAFVFGESDHEWVEIPFETDATQHFQHYRGSSFFSVYLKVPGWTDATIVEYWRNTLSQWGNQSNVVSSLAKVPAGTETMFLRTMGLFLEDGTYVDSGIIEELAIRIFKYDEKSFDTRTSDYFGTLHYLYLLNRADLLNENGDLGLKRIEDDAPVYRGFFNDAPHVDKRARTDLISTMRMNCTRCHSPTYYGAPSILSLGTSASLPVRDPDRYTLLEHASNSIGFTLNSRITRYMESN